MKENKVLQGCYRSIIHLEFLKRGGTLNAHLCVQELQHVDKSFVEKRSVLANRKLLFSSNNDVWLNTARITQEKNWELGWSVLHLPPPIYSPNLAPIDYYRFPIAANQFVWGIFFLCKIYSRVPRKLFHIKTCGILLKSYFLTVRFTLYKVREPLVVETYVKGLFIWIRGEDKA